MATLFVPPFVLLLANTCRQYGLQSLHQASSVFAKAKQSRHISQIGPDRPTEFGEPSPRFHIHVVEPNPWHAQHGDSRLLLDHHFGYGRQPRSRKPPNNSLINTDTGIPYHRHVWQTQTLPQELSVQHDNMEVLPRSNPPTGDCVTNVSHIKP